MKTAKQPNRTSFANLIACLVCCASALLLTHDAQGAFGNILAQYGFPARSLVMSPTQPYMYATIPSQNSIAIINTNTLAVERTIVVGSGPTNLAFSPDGSKAYIANSTSNFVVVFNTTTRAVTNSFALPEHPYDVVFGNQNRLFVLGENNIFQIDATTGASTGPSIGSNSSVFIYGGSLEISPDRNTLYYADYGLSPATMYKFNVSGSTPVLVLQTPFGTVGSNGQDLTLSHNGSFICYATGSGQSNYQIAKFRTSDFATLGSFNTGPYPQQVAFSPDDAVVYAVHTSGEINVFNANTFLSLGTIFGSGEASELTVDSTGRYLFAGYTDSFWGFTGTRVFDTGRIPPTDFNRDGKPDYVLFNASTHRTAIWYLNNNTYVSSAYGPTLPAGWSLVDVGDFNRDGKPDYALFNASTLRTAIWYLNNNVYVSGVAGPTLPTGWSLVAVGDFNRDGKLDFVLFNASTRQTRIWYLNNNVYVSTANGPTLPANWQVVGVADFNRDGRSDYLLFNSSTGQTAIWYLNNNAFVSSLTSRTVPAGYRLTGAGDFNRDSRPDYALFNPSTGHTLIWYMNNNAYVSSLNGPTLPAGWSLVKP
jgi:YVTN family beta-propeller protein